MTRRWQLAVVATVALGFVITTSWLAQGALDTGLMHALAQTNALVEVGPAPPVQAIDRQGRLLGLDAFGGQVIYLNLWAQWCEPCRDELPALNAFAERYRDRLIVLAVSIDEDPAQARAYLDQAFPEGVSFVEAYDPTTQASVAYATTGVPETFIIDRTGQTVARFVGPQAFVSAPYQALADYLIRR